MRRILVSAYGCEPGKGSEQGVGWHWVLEIARTEELWVITRSNNRQAIERALPPEGAARLHFVYYDLPPALRRLKRRDRGLYLYYALWQWGAYRRARQLSEEISFDYCHHLTFGSMWMPTFMHRLAVPFIWGPVGGAESVPSRFLRSLPWRGRCAQYLRTVAVWSSSLNPLFSGPSRAARAIIARTEESRLAFPEDLRPKVRVLLETGMSDALLAESPRVHAGKDDAWVEFVYTGRLVAIKNVESAVRAIAMAAGHHPNVRLTIVGDGPSRGVLTKLARALRVLDRVRFVGEVSQQQALGALQQGDVFLFPSLKEGGTWSLMEAMALGLPVICLDTTGMHVITDDACAIRIPATTPEETVRRMAEAIGRLAGAPELRRQMGECGRKRIREEFSWAQKGIFMHDLLGQLDRGALPPATK